MIRGPEDFRFHDVNDLMIGIAILGPDLQVLHANSYLGKLLDLSPARIKGTSFEHLVTLVIPEGMSWRDLFQGSVRRLQALAFLGRKSRADVSSPLLVTMTKTSQGETLLAQFQVQKGSAQPAYFLGWDDRQALDVVAGYMASLLPDGMNCPSGIKIQSCYLPSAKLAGDWFDYFWITDQKLLIYLVDVSGHGPAAALQAVSLHHLFKSCALGVELMLDPAQTLSRLNALFPIERQHSHFSIWYGLFDVASRQLQFATGGHPPALMMSEAPCDQSGWDSRQGNVRKLSTHGLGIGLMEQADYCNGIIDVKPRDRLIVFSDGLFEFFDPNGQIWSYDALLRYVESNGHSIDVHMLTSQLMRCSGSGQFRDDCSVVLIDFDLAHGKSKATDESLCASDRG